MPVHRLLATTGQLRKIGKRLFTVRFKGKLVHCEQELRKKKIKNALPCCCLECHCEQAALEKPKRLVMPSGYKVTGRNRYLRKSGEAHLKSRLCF